MNYIWVYCVILSLSCWGLRSIYRWRVDEIFYNTGITDGYLFRKMLFFTDAYWTLIILGCISAILGLRVY